MAAVKWIFVVVFGLGSAGALAMAVVSGGAPYAVTSRTAPPIVLRQFPEMGASAALPKTPDAVKTPVAEPVAEKAPDPVAAKPEPVAAKPEPVAARPEPVVAKPAPVAPKPEPVAAKPEPVAPKPEPVAEKPEPVAPKPEPVVAAPKAPPAEGMLNLRATDTADVYLDGKKLGGSPLMGIKAKVGNHKVRFDCYDAAGNTVAGPVQTIAVKADAEVEVEYPCPVE
ncbi:MAG: hypothetical protein Q8N23_10535 [Archangium sp.]|nr:hypothetical protein [Archangium sp.]MDP3153098.1 hypothetical protein [Archangium sp.]MDP3572231.1 hypothetical protein [Archangium sp.]